MPTCPFTGSPSSVGQCGAHASLVLTTDELMVSMPRVGWTSPEALLALEMQLAFGQIT